MAGEEGQGRRILITGISRFLGTGLAAILERHPDVDLIVAVDRNGPVRELARTDIIQSDLTHSLIRKLVRKLEIDTVVHATMSGNTTRHNVRHLHDANVIGTMNVLAGCAGTDSPVRNVVVLSDTAIYGGGPKNPALWSEGMALPATPRTWYERDLREAERYVNEYKALQPNTEVSILRFCEVIGPDSESLMTEYLALPAVPTMLGFDPVVQVMHQEDALDALAKATLVPKSGLFNVAPRGVIPLSQLIELMGKMTLPIIPFAGQEVFVQTALRLLSSLFPPHFLRLIQYGWAVDGHLWERTWGTKSQYTTLEAAALFSRQYRTRKLQEEQTPYVYEAQLEEFLRSKGRQHAKNMAQQVLEHQGGSHRD
ncbi:MAG: NAD-dependent epimerase/dehydratase family protein [Candidatus Dormibacteria bacterium]